MLSQNAHQNENQHDTYFCGFYGINYLFIPRVYTCDDAQRLNSHKEKLFSPFVLFLTIYKLGITMRGHPPVFAHSTDPMDTEDWLRTVERELHTA
jgi:hypothetical protein